VELEGDAELHGIEGANLPMKAVAHDRVPRAVKMDVYSAPPPPHRRRRSRK
jgi:hypothetical protein